MGENVGTRGSKLWTATYVNRTNGRRRRIVAKHSVTTRELWQTTGWHRKTMSTDRVLTAETRVPTNLTKQISRRFPGNSRRDFRKIQDMFVLLRPAMQCIESASLPKYRTKTICTTWGVAKIKKGDQFLKEAIRYPVLSWLETNAVDHRQVTQKFPGGPNKFKEISMISRSCRHPGGNASVQTLKDSRRRTNGNCSLKDAKITLTKRSAPD